MYKPVTLIILDGWGLSSTTEGNGIKKANTPTVDKIEKYYPGISLQASGVSVGIPWGEPGNSEVGHLTLGAGKIIYQNLPRINLSIEDGSFFANESLLKGLDNVKDKKSNLHIMGLLSEGTVHSHYEHLFATLDLASRNNVKNVFIHLFTDGRDSSPTSGVDIVEKLQSRIGEIGVGEIASVCGRNWAMDRNNNWDRTQKSYDALTLGKGEPIKDPVEYLRASYKKDVTDEYIEPAVVTKKDGTPLATIQDNDTIIFYNFREDRARQITKAFSVPDFDKIKKEKFLDVTFVTFTEYEKDLPVLVVFPPEKVRFGLGEVLSENHKKQLRIAETEKYAHVTYFFNGGKETSWPGEDRELVPSPTVSKFDEKPRMSADEITQKTIEAIELRKYDFILLNYANADMVGHTGNEKAVIEAVEAVDENLSKLIPVILKEGGCVLITADHGNAEELENPSTGEHMTEHSNNPVPFWLVTPTNHLEEPLSAEEIVINQRKVAGLLSDVAPTVLEIMGIQKPEEMSGESLIPMLSGE
ncbi:MAG: 2,3-bisphosphoglycerate-independent phosphoglycerate mutase [Candidatus Moranbacteria bacterium]|nr:2,3-bisphosphoglycerate-independent phosphoglycerate mutase [Candidatus Moranbacteria bacterium]